MTGDDFSFDGSIAGHAEREMDWSALDAYLSGRSSPEEVQQIEQWAAQDPARAELLAAVRRIWDAAAVSMEPFDAEAAVRRLRAARTRTRAGLVPAREQRVVRWHPSEVSTIWRKRSRTVPAAIAALLVVSLGVAGWWWRSHAAPAASPHTTLWREYATARGQRAEVLLTDGTRVWLSVDSRLRVPMDYGARARTVRLEGEAFFDVQHDARRPFRVQASGAVAEDLGTRFLVRAYPDDPGAMVVVAEGSVALGPDSTPAPRGVSLERGERGDIDPSGFVTVTPDVDVDRYLAWRHGRLELEHVPLERAIHDLERWYGITITLSDSSLAQVPVTARLESGSVDDALDVLARTLGIRYARHDMQVRLLAGGPPRPPA
ncbi:MAG: FecR domain-containing protein, partial [Gemmatimonadaceae bacterium]|nr:FecR domain-containing protein [Gemmatimonadaceae bacterium]